MATVDDPLPVCATNEDPSAKEPVPNVEPVASPTGEVATDQSPPHRTWQPVQRRLRRRWRIGIVLTVLCGLLAAFAWVLVAPFHRPDLQVVIIGGMNLDELTIDNLLVTPIRLPADRLRQPLADRDPNRPPLTFRALTDGESLLEARDELTALRMNDDDVLLIVCDLLPVVEQKRVQLRSRIDPTDPEAGRLPLRTLANTLRRATPGPIVVCLRPGTAPDDPRRGVIANDLRSALEWERKDIRDAEFHVLLSVPMDAPGWSQFLADGLSGEADTDGNGIVTLREFATFADPETSGETAARQQFALCPVATREPVAQTQIETEADPTPGEDDPAHMSVPELLNAADRLCDAMRTTHPGLLGNAPPSWRRFEGRLRAIDRVSHIVPDALPEPLVIWLRERVSELRELSEFSSAAPSGWQERFLGSESAALFAPGPQWSSALVLSEARQRNRVPDPSVPATRRQLIEWSRGDDASTFAVTEENTPPLASCSELAFVDRLRSASFLTPKRKRQLLRVRLAAENLAADAIATERFGELLIEADRLRWRAERVFLSDPSPQRVAFASRLLDEAEQHYRRLEEQRGWIFDAMTTRDRCLDRLAMLRRPLPNSLPGAEGFSDQDDAFAEYISRLVRLTRQLAPSDSASPLAIRRTARAMMTAERRLNRLPEPAPLSDRNALTAAETRSLRSVTKRCRQEWLWLKLVRPVSKLGTEPSPLTNEWEAVRDASDHTRPGAVSRFELALVSWLSGVPDRLSAAERSTPAEWLHVLRLIDVRDELAAPVEAATHRERDRRWQTVLRFQSDRRSLERSDADPAIATAIERELAELRHHTGQHTDPPTGLLVELESTTRNDHSGSTVWRVRLTNQSGVPQPVRVWQTANSAGVRAPAEFRIHALPPSIAVPPFAPYSADHSHRPPSVSLNPGESRTLVWQAMRSESAERSAAAVLRFVGGGHTQRLEIRFPPVVPPLAIWSVNDDADRSEATLPNTARSSRLRIRNPSAKARTVDVIAFPRTRFAGSPPREPISIAEGDAWLSRRQLPPPVATWNSIELPPTGESIELPVPKPSPNSTPVSMSEGLLFCVRDGAANRMSFLTFRGVTIAADRLIDPVLAYDATTEQLSLTIRADRTALPTDLNWPTEGLSVVMTLRDRKTDRTVVQRGRLRNTDTPLRFEMDCPQRRQGPYHVTLDLAGWSRVIEYELTTAESRLEIPPQRRTTSVEFTGPDRQASFRLDASSIRIGLRVTLPADAENSGGRVRVGIDRRGNRRLGPEAITLTTARQYGAEFLGGADDGSLLWRTTVSDFTFDLPLAGIREGSADLVAVTEADGRSVWTSRSVVFDGTGPRITRPEVQTTRDLLVGNEIAIDVVSDDAGLSGTSAVEAMIDREGTGTFSSNIAPVPALCLTTESGTRGNRWRVMLPTKGIPSGPVTVLLRATDAVGNIGPIRKLRLHLWTAEQAQARRDARTTEVLGSVMHVNRPVAEAVVTLTKKAKKPRQDPSAPEQPPTSNTFRTKSNANGEFAFPAVPDGTYVVSVTASVAGRRIELEQTLSVSVDAPPDELTLELFPKSK